MPFLGSVSSKHPGEVQIDIKFHPDFNGNERRLVMFCFAPGSTFLTLQDQLPGIPVPIFTQMDMQRYFGRPVPLIYNTFGVGLLNQQPGVYPGLAYILLIAGAPICVRYVLRNFIDDGELLPGRDAQQPLPNQQNYLFRYIPHNRIGNNGPVQMVPIPGRNPTDFSRLLLKIQAQHSRMTSNDRRNQ